MKIRTVDFVERTIASVPPTLRVNTLVVGEGGG